MNIKEFNNVKHYNYLDYCDYLQTKYGLGPVSYMTKNWNKNPKASRTAEGLVAHHKMEDTAIMLGMPMVAKQYPYEWQSKENLIYCDYLEHFFLHVLIYQYPSPEKRKIKFGDTSFPIEVGIGGAELIAATLNDLYSGWFPKQQWQINCCNRVKNDKETYLAIYQYLLGIKTTYEKTDIAKFISNRFFKSMNAQYGQWDPQKNTPLYNEINKLIQSSKVR